MQGLTSSEVLEIRKNCGPNEIVANKLESNFKWLINIFTDPMGLMLLGLGTIYWILNKHNDAIVLFISFIPITAVDVILEIKTKKALSALSASLKKTANVIRDGKIIEIPIREIVIGDLVLFEEGQSLPADGEILECEQLNINEAALTGESLPIVKSIGESFYAGTTTITGKGIGRVNKIGPSTKFGKIAKLLEDSEEESSPLKIKINNIIKKVLIIAIVLAILLFVVTFIKNQNWAESLIESLTFGMAAIPEEFPLVFTLYLSLGAYRLSKHGVLIKSLPSVETLGSVDVICTDKTGTLTEGSFKLENLEIINSKFSNELNWTIALMACEEKPIDAMEIAIFKKAEPFQKNLINYQLKWDYQFESIGKHMSHVWKNNDSNEMIMGMKGSVEGVIEHCQLSSAETEKINQQTAFWASKGKRILGLAGKQASFTGERSTDEIGLNFIGLLIFSDPIRTSAKDAIEKCQSEGIEVKMLTGDHLLTAHAIADELNIQHNHQFIFNGDQLLKMTEVERRNAYLNGSIFSRVLPEQKHEMVSILKQNGKIVAMTGDGINDAPALKIADIGISMGENATDVARSSAKMILMKNDFNGIVEAIFEGRSVFSNLKRSFSYLISFHLPIIFFALIAPLFNYANILLPIHIVIMELIVHPISAFSFENLPNTDKKKDKFLMSKKRFIESLLSGIMISFGSLYLYFIYSKNMEMDYARTMAISTLLLGNIFFVLIETYPLSSSRVLYTIIALIIFTLGIQNISSLARIFYLMPLSLNDLGICLLTGAISIIPSFILRNFVNFTEQTK